MNKVIDKNGTIGQTNTTTTLNDSNNNNNKCLVHVVTSQRSVGSNVTVSVCGLGECV